MPTIPEITLLVLWLPVHLQIHEGSHAIAAHLQDVKVVAYKPLPYVDDNRFYLGSVEVQYPKNLTNKQINDKDKYIAAAPYTTDLAIYNSSNVAINYIDNKQAKRILILLGMFAPLIDSSFNYIGSYRHNHSDFRYVSKNDKYVVGVALTSAWINALVKWSTL